jgi:hypothetical protein
MISCSFLVCICSMHVLDSTCLDDLNFAFIFAYFSLAPVTCCGLQMVLIYTRVSFHFCILIIEIIVN